MNYVLFQYKGHEMLICDGDRKIMVEGLSRNNHMTTTTTNTFISSSSSSSGAANNSTSIKNAVLCKSCKYSDNNHLVRFDWYYKFIGGLGIGSNKRPPEGPGQYNAARRCEQMGLYLYYSAEFEIGKERGVDYALRHLDGPCRTGS